MKLFSKSNKLWYETHLLPYTCQDCIPLLAKFWPTCQVWLTLLLGQFPLANDLCLVPFLCTKHFLCAPQKRNQEGLHQGFIVTMWSVPPSLPTWLENEHPTQQDRAGPPTSDNQIPNQCKKNQGELLNAMNPNYWILLGSPFMNFQTLGVLLQTPCIKCFCHYWFCNNLSLITKLRTDYLQVVCAMVQIILSKLPLAKAREKRQKFVNKTFCKRVY